jgi:hypothetical protein
MLFYPILNLKTLATFILKWQLPPQVPSICAYQLFRRPEQIDHWKMPGQKTG